MFCWECALLFLVKEINKYVFLKMEKKKESIFPIQRHVKTENAQVDSMLKFMWLKYLITVYILICSLIFFDTCTMNNKHSTQLHIPGRQYSI